MATGIVSDRYKWRGGVMSFSALLSIIGYAMYLTALSRSIKYASLFFSVSGAYAAPAGLFAWVVRHRAFNCALSPLTTFDAHSQTTLQVITAEP